MNLTWVNVKGAIVSGVLMAILAMAVYIISTGDIFKIDYHDLANAGVLAGLTAVVSLIKSLLTTDSGNFLGVVNIK